MTGTRASYAGARLLVPAAAGSDRGRGLLHPDLVVMECRATDGSDSLGPGQHVDAAAVDMRLVRMDGFGDQHAAAYTVKYLHGQCGFTPRVAERHRIAIGNGKA